ncbi:hypothetical protein ABI59_07125 [Acidobacteria bacterium Mor1]|nr:hypothetical protein ABI59_07125 [Acidobacteria bacterium Mor1]
MKPTEPLSADAAAALRAEVGERVDECVHCGFCLPDCPTYVQLGSEMDSPRGRIYLVKALTDRRIAPDETVLRHLDRCLDCRACETACPSGVRYGEIIEGARAHLEPLRERGWFARRLRSFALNTLLPNHRLLKLATLPLRIAELTGTRPLLERLPGAPGRLLRMAPRPKQGPFLESAERHEAQGERRGTVALFAGCVMNQTMGEVHQATARVLARHGFDVVTPRAQTCCGALHVHNGERDTARELARRNLDALLDPGIDHVVVNSAGCGAQLREYGHLLAGDPRAEALASRTLDAAELLGSLDEAEWPTARAEAEEAGSLKVAYDEPCHLLHAQGVSSAPRRLLASIPGVELVPLEEAEMCCGSAGVYNLVQPELSHKILERKLEHVAESGAEVIVTANPGCHLQLTAGLRRSGSSVRVMHLMELLDETAGHS